MKRIIYSLTLLCLIFGNQSFAQMTITGEINARPEFRNGFKSPILDSQDPAFFIEQRSRVYFNYKTEKYEIQFNLQDIRMWGGDGQVYKSSSALTAVHNAWARYYFNDAWSFKLGRQTISYDNQRFLGGLEWAMQGRQHDALLFLYEKDGLKVHVGGAFNQNPVDGAEPARLVSTNYTSPGNSPYHATGNYKHMEYLWANKKFESGLTGSLYLVNDARQDMALGVPVDGSVNARQTYGLMLGFPVNDQLKLDGEFFYQGGKVANDTDLSALMFSASATLKTDITPLTLGIDYLSGDDESTADKIESFAPAFGTNHAFYGYMDYFYVGNGHAGGLQDIYLKTKFSFAGGSLTGHLHYFMSAADVTDSESNTADKGLGTEIDLVYVKQLAEGVTWKLGYSHMFDTDAMKAVKGMDVNADTGMNNWAWTQIIFKPVLYKSKKAEDK